MQVQPVIKKIINELAIDCDRFFDEVADLNQQHIEAQRKSKTSTTVLKIFGTGSSVKEEKKE